ncbi:MAG: hypothetical protein R3F59_01460 [Myxococcota bacterium]
MLSCAQGSCDIVCDGPDCDVSCDGGGCQIHCDGDNCNTSCAGGGCNVTCTATVCSQSCAGDGCNATCTADADVREVTDCNGACVLTLPGRRDLRQQLRHRRSLRHDAVAPGGRAAGGPRRPRRPPGRAAARGCRGRRCDGAVLLPRRP